MIPCAELGGRSVSSFGNLHGTSAFGNLYLALEFDLACAKKSLLVIH